MHVIVNKGIDDNVFQTNNYTNLIGQIVNCKSKQPKSLISEVIGTLLSDLGESR